MPEYFTLAELREHPDVSNESRYPDDVCEQEAAFVVAHIERVCQTSFIARTVSDERHDGGDYGVWLRKPFILSVTSAAESGVAVTGYTFRVAAGNRVQKFAAGAVYPTRWAYGFQNVTVTYSAGYSASVPDDLAQAAIAATRLRLIERTTGATGRRQTVTNESGTVQFQIAKDDRLGYPQIDSVILGWRDRLGPSLA